MVIGILVLAAYMRLGQPGVTEFKRDEATLSRLALDLAQGENFTWLGIGSSVGFPNSPVSVYLMALPYAAGHNPVLAVLYIGFLNLLAVALVWKFSRRYFGSGAATFAALFYAASPWAAIYSRKIWAQDLLPLFVVATLFTGCLGFLENRPKRWAQLLFLPLLAFTCQIHFGAFVLVPVAALLIGLGWRRFQRTTVLLSLLMGMGVGMPFLYGLQDADLLRLSAIRDSLDRSNSAHARELSTTIVDYAWFTLAGQDIHSLTGENQFLNYLNETPNAYPLLHVFPLLALLGAGSLVFSYRPPSLWLVILAWCFVPVGAYLYTWTAVHPHYLIPMMPAAFILMGVGAALIVERLQKISPKIASGVVALGMLPLIMQVVMFTSLLNFLDRHATAGAFGTPLHYLLDIRHAVLQTEAEAVMVVSTESSPQFETLPAVWDILLDDIESLTFINGTKFWRLPDSTIPVLLAPGVDLESQFGASMLPAQTFPLRPGEGIYQFWTNNPVRLPAGQLILNAQFENGVILESGWRNDSALFLVWRLPHRQPDEVTVVFVHMLDENGERLGQVDEPFFVGKWENSVRIIFRTELPLNQAHRLSIGMYTLTSPDTYRNSALLDSQGSYLAQSLVVTLSDFALNP